jgi:vitamin B12 transporter
MHKRLVLFCQLLTGFGTVSAQFIGVQGTVLDPDGLPIRGARVECAGQSVISDSNGRFRVEGIARCPSLVAAPGFEPRRVELSSASDARIELAVAGVVERIVVTATRHQTTAEEAGVAASVVNASDLAQLQFPPVADVLRALPGLQVTTTGRHGGQTSVFSRGAQRTGTLVLIDGVPVNDPGGEFNLAHLTSGDIDRVEVVRGPESALFGAEAASGVIQLFTRRGDPERKTPAGSVSYERGSFDTDAWKAGLAGGSGGASDYSLHAEQFRTAGEFRNDDYRNTTGSANAGLRLAPGTQLRGVLRTTDSVVGVPGQVAYGLIDLDARETNRDTSLSLRLDDARGDHYLQQFSFAYHRVRDLYTDAVGEGPYALAALVRDVPLPQPRTYLVSLLDPAHLPSVVPEGMRLVTQTVTLYPLTEPFLSATSRKRLGYQGNYTGSGAALVFGYDYERQEGDISASGVARDNHGFFIHAQHTLAGRMFLSGGLRVEHSNAYGRKLAPRGALGFLLAGRHGPLSSTFLRVSAGRGITEPSLLQNYARDPWFVGNPGLRPEKTASYEAGLVQEWFGRRARTEVALFHNSFDDLIAFITLASPPWGTWQNIQASRARGVEFSGRARLVGTLTLTAAYTHLRTRVIHSNTPTSPFYGVGQELARRPGNSGSLLVSVAPRRWWFTAGAVLVGERQDADLLGVTRNPGYQNIFAGGSYRLSRHVSPFVRGENLLNSRYQEALGYSSLSRALTGGIRVEW